MPCVTPSQPVAIPPGESLGIEAVLERTNGGSLYRDGRSMTEEPEQQGGQCDLIGGKDYTVPDISRHRATEVAFLQAQATREIREVEMLHKNFHLKSEEQEDVSERLGRKARVTSVSRSARSKSIRLKEDLAAERAVEGSHAKTRASPISTAISMSPEGAYKLREMRQVLGERQLAAKPVACVLPSAGAPASASLRLARAAGTRGSSRSRPRLRPGGENNGTGAWKTGAYLHGAGG